MTTELQAAEFSTPFNEIATALAKAQLAIKGAAKDSENPHFKSRYAPLSSVWDACHEALNAQGIAIVQIPSLLPDGSPVLVTLLAHGSGQWFRSVYRLKPAKDDPQGLGSAVTYARRYALAAMTGVAPKDDDDDGEAASGRSSDKRGGWDKLRDDDKRDEQKKPDNGPTEFKPVADTTDTLPDDIADVKRELQPFKGKKFAELADTDVAAIGRVIEEMASKTKSQNNRVALTILGAVIRNEVAKRKGAA